jgi:EmrB/QacA subfamily drug resistance transporter
VVTPTQDRAADRRRWIALAVCCSALFMTLLDLSVTNVALPSIGDSTGAGPAQLQWIVSGYTLAFGMVPVLGGRLGDDHGRRFMFIVGVAGFVVTSALSGISPNGGLLITARVLQGLAGGLINPQVSGLVQQMFHGRDRGRAFGVIGTVVALGTALGPVVGGLLIAVGGEDFGWRLVFFVNVPLGALVIALAARWLPGPDGSAPARRPRLDVLGAALLGLTTLCVLFPTVQYDTVRDARLFWLLAPALPLGLVFLRREWRLTRTRSDPLVDLRLFRQPSYTVGVLLALLYFCAFTGLPLVLALYYQLGLGFSALQSGLGVTAFALGSAVSAPLVGRMVGRFGRPLVIWALVVFGAGALAIDLVVRGTEPTTDPMTALLRLALPLLLLGIGSGGVITPNQALSLQDVDPRMGGAAGGVLQTSQRIGSAVGQAVIGSVFFAALAARAVSPGHRDPAAYSAALSRSVIATLAFTAAALALGVTDLVLTRRRVVARAR